MCLAEPTHRRILLSLALLLAITPVGVGRTVSLTQESTDAVKAGRAYTLLAQIELAQNRLDEALDALDNAFALTASTDANSSELQGQIQAIKGCIESRENRRDPSYVGPTLLNTPMPVYTEEARIAKVQGVVRMAVLVNERGVIDSTIVLSGLGFGLDQEATKVVRQLKFKPAVKDGKPVNFWQKIDIEFNLR